MNMTDEYVIKAPVLLPFIPIDELRCSACGHHLTQWDALLARILLKSVSCLDAIYCAGNKEPTELATSLPAAIMGITQERTNPCAGIYEPHLHLRCRRCGWTTMMRTQQKG